jgi:hypothetical protein
MKFTVQLVEQDMHEAMKLHITQNRSLRRWAVGLLAIFILGVAVTLYKGVKDGDWETDLFIVLLILVLFPIFFYRAMKKQVAKLFQQQKDLRNPYMIEFSETGYVTEGSNGTTRMIWSNVHRWEANDHILLLYQSDMLFNLLPFRFLPETERQQVLQMVESKLGKPKS